MILPSQEKNWLKFFDEEATKAEVPRRTIYEHLVLQNTGYENYPALRYFNNVITYGSLIQNIQRCASAFEKLGVQKNEYVAVLSASIPEMVYCMYGLSKIGATMLAIDPRRSRTEIRDFIQKGKCRIIVVLDLAYEHISAATEGLAIDHRIIVSASDSLNTVQRIWQRSKQGRPSIPEQDGIRWWKDFISFGADRRSRTETYADDHVAAVTLTGGTTGTPKGVKISDTGFNAVALSFQYCGVPYDRSQKFMDIIPMFSSYGAVSSLHMPLSLGLELILIPKFDSEQGGKLICRYRPEHTLMVPAHYEKMIGSREMRRGTDLSFFLTAGTGGDTMNLGAEEKVNQFLKDHGGKYPISQGYGLSENSSAVSCCCNGNFKSGSVGYPLLTVTVGIFRPGTAEELDYDQEGEICVSGPTCMLGYLENEEETEKVLLQHPDGQIWVHTGDIGVMDREGFLFIRGRIKRTIARADGHKIYPAHMESVIGVHPDIVECAVVGVSDRNHGQGMNAMAVLSLKEGCDEQKVIQEVRELCLQLEERARPEEIRTMEELPHTAMGKIDYEKITVMVSR